MMKLDFESLEFLKQRGHETGAFVRPNVRAKATVEADADWPRKENLHRRLEQPGGGCRSGSPP
jgi:hypothetical protein